MTTATTSPDRAQTTTRGVRFARATQAQFLVELRLLLREPAALIFGAVLPLVAVTVMAAIPAARQPLPDMGGLAMVQVYTPPITMFATSIIGLTLLPAIVGGYRELGVLRRLRTTPVSPMSLLVAVLAVLMLAGLVVSALIVAIPALVGVPLPARLGMFAWASGLALLSFAALGGALAALIASAKVASGVGNAVAALMWFFAGMWLPRAFFPDWLTVLAGLTPSGAAAEAMTSATTGGAAGWEPFAVLIAWTIGAALVASATFRWE